VGGLARGQIRQAASKAQRNMNEKEEEQSWDLVQEAVRRNLVAGEREVFRRKQELARQIAEEQRRQAEESRIRKVSLSLSLSVCVCVCVCVFVCVLLFVWTRMCVHACLESMP